MRLPRFRFTIRQLIAAVAILAVLFSLLRTPSWPLVIAIVPVLPGFAIDRARGRSGILGATVAGGIGSAGCGIVCLTYLYLTHDPFLTNRPTRIFSLTLLLGAVGLGWGGMVGLEAYLIVLLGKAIGWIRMPIVTGGPIARRRIEDCGPRHSQAGDASA
jgi:hypothetical protein